MMITTSSQAPCRLCRVTRSGDADDEVLVASPSFLVVTSVGSLLDGWLLIVPRRHILSMRACTLDEVKEFRSLTANLRTVLQEEYRCGVVTFEHGPARASTRMGCGVDHAHLHVVPTELDLLAQAGSIDPDLRWGVVDAYASIAQVSGTRDYLFYSDQGAIEYVATGTNIPSQFFRRLIARLTGQADQWNWRDHPRPEVSSRTRDRLRAHPSLLAVGTPHEPAGR